MEESTSEPGSVWGRELAQAQEIAAEAGALVLDHYARAQVAVYMKDDFSPVTEADLASHALIVERLGRAFPGDRVLSEEAADDVRLGAGRVWLVDPLDGTRDFVGRSGDFAVHVGLVVDGVPVVGAVHVPVLGCTYGAAAGGPAKVWYGREVRVVRCSEREPGARSRIAVGRFHTPPNVAAFLRAAPFGLEVVRLGASRKLMALAAGDLELALWLHDREKVWDSCAPAVIVVAAGGAVTDVDGAPLSYAGPDVQHRRGIVASNGRDHAAWLALCRPWFRAQAEAEAP